MNLYAKLTEREAAGRPIRIGLIGAGKFGTMFLDPGAAHDRHASRGARRSRRRAREKPAHIGGLGCRAILLPASLGDALKGRTSFVTDDADALIACADIDVIVEATGDPKNGIRFALAAIEHGKHIVMVNVEADALAGPLLARKARAAGVVYSLAWGDQPALICEQVDWARACGFKVISAGKGTRYHPTYHRSNPDTVWEILDKYLKIDDRNSINPKMFNSFIDGTKSGIEMTAVCNATGLVPQTNGLGFPPASRFELADICKPKSEGGALEMTGVTEVVSSVDRDERDVPHHLAMGTFVVFEGESAYARQCFREYHLMPDNSGRYAALVPADAHDRTGAWDFDRLGGAARRADRHAHRASTPMWSRPPSAISRPARCWMERAASASGANRCRLRRRSMQGVCRSGLAHQVRLRSDIAEGAVLRWSDVDFDAADLAVRMRREMEAAFGRRNAAAEAS